MYDVYLDDIYFYGVSTVSSPGDRKLTVYNGIGTGYFPKADDPQLKKWSWECELQEFPEHYHDQNFKKASEIKKALDNILESKEPSRLVIKSDYDSISQEVMLESRDFKEIYAGVFSVRINVTEYKAAAVRTTDIPDIPRPGKIPETPTFTVDKDETVYDKIPEAEQSWSEPPSGIDGNPLGPDGELLDPETHQPINPVDPPENKEINWKEINWMEEVNKSWKEVVPPEIQDDFFFQKVVPGVKDTWNNIKDIYDNWYKKHWQEAKNTKID